MPKHIPSGFCPCCENGPIPDTALWCDTCAGHVSRDSTLALWDRTYEAVNGQPCPLSLWQCPDCGCDRQEWLPTSRNFVCANCLQVVQRVHAIPPDIEAAVDAMTEDELTEELLGPRPTEPAALADWLWASGEYATPAKAAIAIGYAWTEADQAKHERETYVEPSFMDKIDKMIGAMSRASVEGRE